MSASVTLGTSNVTYTYEVRPDGTAHLIGVSDCCKCKEPTEDYVLCPRCGSVKR